MYDGQFFYWAWSYGAARVAWTISDVTYSMNY